jgi:glycolate oxidase FAD binding subunit
MDNRTIRSKFIDIVGRDGFIDDESIRSFLIDGLSPRAVLFPRTPEMVEEIVLVAAQHSLSIFPWGGGTRIDLGASPRALDLVLCMRDLNAIVDQDHENMSVTAQAGIRLGALQESLSGVGAGFFLPLDPPNSEEATLGGAVATNASGPCRLRYGTLRDLVLGLEAVIPEGLERQGMVASGGKTVKNVSGYDMSKLYIGSLGSLAIIIEVTCRILPLPEDRATVVAAFQTRESTWAYTQAVLDSQLLPSAIEAYNHEAACLLRGHAFGSEEQDLWVAVKLEGIGEAIAREIGDIERFAKSEGAYTTTILRGPDEREFWKSFGELGQVLKRGNTWSIGLKTNVPPSMLPSVFESAARHFQKAGIPPYQFSHAGTGIVHTYVPLNEDRYRDNEEFLIQAAKSLRDQAADIGGSLVVDYAPPLFKQRFDVWGEVGATFSIMERLKKEFDPRSILNPGRFVGGL